MSVVEQLIEMGFDKEKAEAAAKSSETLEGAIEWIVAHDSINAAPSNPAPSSATSSEEVVTEAAASFKCNTCGKLFRDENGMMFHANKTKHDDFSESSEVVKPLTDEEKKAKVEELREKIRAHRAIKEKQEEEEKRELEKRRKNDMKAMLISKEQRREKEMLEAAAIRKREKLEDEKRKREILEQIRHDREARKAAAASGETATPKAAPAPAPAPVQPLPPKDYEHTTIQIRLLDGKVIKQQFKAKEPLAMVRAWIDTNYGAALPYKMLTPFPRRVFTNEDMGAPLNQLDLVPSASITLAPQ
ncbi:unnamed protein product [Caenorhabditis bovis]|uniref:UBX domain-containing protein n=1 Tax=Caenorhabditis bovis TaxID=2654633 RepID=A0A8S1F2S1_9PELO|nr:unnamed protein product [Caenorhabditis bovis]